MNNLADFGATVMVIIILIAATLLMAALFFWVCWNNALAHAIDGVNQIGYWQSVGLLFMGFVVVNLGIHIRVRA